MEPQFLLLITAVLAGLYMAWSIGANDVANAMGTSIGSHAITIKQAIFIAAIFEFLGALLAGEQVTNTIKQGIIEPSRFTHDPIGFAAGMTISLLATALWLQFAAAKGWPVSTTHSIVGALVGFGMVSEGYEAVQWSALLEIFASWLVSPFLGGVIAFITFFIVRQFIIDSVSPLVRAQKIVPGLFFIVIYSILSLLLNTGIFQIENKFLWAITIIISLLVAIFVRYALARLNTKLVDRDEILREIERVFGYLQVTTACFMALAHGSNDVANAIGPVAAVIAIVKHGHITPSSTVPLWLLAFGGLGIVIGLATYGRKVIETIGKGITEITPTRGFAAEFGVAFTVLLGSQLGLPLSTTQVLVGAVIGVGLARGIAGLNIAVIRTIVTSWLITIPLTAGLSVLLCLLWARLR